VVVGGLPYTSSPEQVFLRMSEWDDQKLKSSERTRTNKENKGFALDKV